MTDRGNIHADPPDASRGEVIETLARLASGEVRVERIFTHGQASPAGFWYDQTDDEWVMILTGGAELEFDDPAAEERLSPGDWLLIPARRKHRVRSALPDTLWVAVHARPASCPPGK